MSVDLSTKYLGLDLKNPLVVSACTLTGRIDSLRLLEEAGAAAAVLPSLFEEQIQHDEMAIHHFYESHSDAFPEALTFFPEMDDDNTGPERYLRHLEEAKNAVSIPIIGSLNGVSRGGWIDYARRIQDAGADALELNVYFVATDPDETAEQVERRYLELVEAVRKAVTIPVAVKIGPFFSSLPNMARRLIAAGADGLVLFNRFLQPDIDLETLRVEPRFVFSQKEELRLPLRWMAILRPQIRDASLAATSGIQTSDDLLKLLLAGADVGMVASSLYQHGIGHIRPLLQGANDWLNERNYTSVRQMRGSMSQKNSPDPGAFERANYVKTLVDFSSGRTGSNP